MTTVILLVLALILVGCGANPAGPVVNNSGDGNAFNFAGDESNDNDVTTPAPVNPVVVAPPASEVVE